MKAVKAQQTENLPASAVESVNVAATSYGLRPGEITVTSIKS
jgi:hypothetical protein